MSRWPSLSLSECLIPAGESVPVEPEGEYPNFGIYSFGRGLFEMAPIRGLTSSARTLTRVKAGQFIYSRLFAFEGAYGVVPDRLDGYYVTNEYPVFDCSPEHIDAGYLGWYFKQPAVWAAIAQGSKGLGVRRQRVQPEQVLRHRIPIPPLAEQRRIVARLDTLTDKVRQVTEKLDTIEADAEAMALSLHHRLAGDRVVRLGDVIELYEDSVSVVSDGSYPQVGVRGFGGGLFPKPPTLGTDTTYKAFNRLYADAIVLSQVKGWEGALAVCPRSLAGMFVSPEYRTFRCLDGAASPIYLGELMKTPWFWSLLQSATRGVGARRERTRPEQFLALELPMPSYTEQLRAVEILLRQLALKAHHATIREANSALLPAMLERLFRQYA